MDMHTSTPLIISKQSTNEPIRRKVDMVGHVTQQLFQNTSAQNKKADDNWDAFEGPCFAEFNSGISELHDSYFDTRKSDNDTPSRKCQLLPSTSTETDSFISCFQNCSISKIGESSLNNTTLKGSVTIEDADNTLLSNLVPKIMPINNISNNKSTGRRQSTAMCPFSFEMREKEKQERKQARIQYQVISQQLTANKFQAVQSSKFAAPPKLQNIVKKKGKKDTVKGASGASRQADKNVVHILPANPGLKFNVQPESNSVKIKIHQKQESIIENVEQIGHRMEIKDPWKRTPFQVIISKRPLTVPRSPKLLTAHRAQTRKLYEERLLEKEKQELTIRKMRVATQHQREKDDIAKLHKECVHKVAPILQYRHMPLTMQKRPLADPINPIFAKRRRWM